MLAKFTTLLTNSVIRDISGALNPYNISLYTEGERETERERERERVRGLGLYQKEILPVLSTGQQQSELYIHNLFIFLCHNIAQIKNKRSSSHEF